MLWLPVLALMGALFLAFAAVEWGLFRLEEKGEQKVRAMVFLALGAAFLLTFAAGNWALWWQVRPAAASAPAAPLPEVALLEHRLLKEFAMIQMILEDQVNPSLSTITEARLMLMDSRRDLARDASPESPVRELEQQSDAMLGVAYHALGARWLALKDPQAQIRAEAERSIQQLKAEVERWNQIRDCLSAIRLEGCRPRVALSPREVKMRGFSRWFHPVMLDLIRFEENDPDLVDTSASEHRRLREVLARAEKDLSAMQTEPWSSPMISAAQEFLRAAEQALQRESAAVAQGNWSGSRQRSTYQPVRTAFLKYFQIVSCLSDSVAGTCG